MEAGLSRVSWSHRDLSHLLSFLELHLHMKGTVYRFTGPGLHSGSQSHPLPRSKRTCRDLPKSLTADTHRQRPQLTHCSLSTLHMLTRTMTTLAGYAETHSEPRNLCAVPSLSPLFILLLSSRLGFPGGNYCPFSRIFFAFLFPNPEILFSVLHDEWFPQSDSQSYQ